MVDFLKNNPGWLSALIEAFVVAVLNLFLAFGVHVTGEQTAAINAVVIIVLTLGLGLLTKTAIQRQINKGILKAKD